MSRAQDSARAGGGGAPADSNDGRNLSIPSNDSGSQNTAISSGNSNANTSRIPGRPNLPVRASTGETPQPDHTHLGHDHNHARSEDLSHTPLSSSPGLLTERPANLAPSLSSRPGTPQRRKQSSSVGHSDDSDNALTSTSSASNTLTSASCLACSKPMQGPFVRALGTVFHLQCFKCMDCGEVVASKFFPIEGPDGRQFPLCERDYFRRLNLICAKCGMALRGSYITACNKKFHVEHFTCSLCSTLFGPQDSYYEHDGDVFCHFHYSTRFATKCAGCSSAILKQFVEINRNMRDECWHPECYMINKFWNVKVVSRRPTSAASLEGTPEDPAYLEEEERESSTTLKEKQVKMEQQVYRIWTVLSAFEESSAACISDMLRQVSNGQYSDAIRMAEKFILHVEVLFATIDDLEYHFGRMNQKGMSHVREARMLCRKTVELFGLLSNTQETGSRRMGMTQELLALVTGLAHYLKILIRIALTGALKLEREQSSREAMAAFLDKLHLLAVQGGNPTARRMIKGSNGEVLKPTAGGNYGTQGVTYGFRSLAPENAGESPFATNGTSAGGKNTPPSDLCVKCNLTVEEDCVRLGTYQRWHSHCVSCAHCGKIAAVPVPKEVIPPKNPDDKDAAQSSGPKLSTARRPPANVDWFVYEVDSKRETSSFGDVPTVILCTEHAHAGCRPGFQAVSRLEQYAFLLNVALRRLYLLLRKQGVVPLSPVATTVASQGQNTNGESDPYRNSADIMRMKSVHLDRKISATARLPKRSTIVESPAGRSVRPSDVLLHSQRSQELPMQQRVAAQHGQQGQVSTSRSPPTSNQRPSQPYSGKLPGGIDVGGQSPQGQLMKPSLGRGNTEVMIVDESAPSSPAGAIDETSVVPPVDDGITLADIPQIMEAAQARQQQRSLPRENSTPYIAELSALELAIVKHAAVVVLYRSSLKDQFDLDELLEFVEVKKSGFWNKLFKSGNAKKNVKNKGVFSVPLELLVEREGADSVLGATRATIRIPSFIEDVISAMRQMDMSIEGIFRKNGNIRRLKDLTEAIDRDPSSVDLSSDNPVQLAALLKKFLRELPDPLMTFKLHRLFIASQTFSQAADRRRFLHLVSLLLPKSHRDTMEVLFVFLKWVASFAHMDEETGSKMDLGNLATVICPSILYSRGQNAVRDESFGSIRVVQALLENQDEFFTVPEEFMSILHDQEYFANSMDLPSKDFMKKCETYMRVKGSAPAGRPPPAPPLYTNNNANGSTPRFAQSGTPNPDRPGVDSYASSSTVRQMHPGMPPSSVSYPSTSSLNMVAPNTHQRPNQTTDDVIWPTAAPRPMNPSNMNSGVASPSPRPSSYAQPRQSGEGPPLSYSPSPNGYPSAVRQRI